MASQILGMNFSEGGISENYEGEAENVAIAWISQRNSVLIFYEK
jgi:hypothetical protein